MNARSVLVFPVLAFSVAAPSFWSLPALAVPPAASAEKSDAAAQFEEGLRLLAKNDFEGARRAFEDSYLKSMNPRALNNLALMEQKLGLRAQAAEHFARYLDLPDSAKTDAPTRKHASEQLAQLAGQLCRLSLNGPLDMQTRIGSRVVRGAVAFVEPGQISVQLVAAAGPRQREFACSAGEGKQVDYEERAEAPVAPANVGGVVPAGDPPKPPVVVPTEPKTERTDGYLYVAIGAGLVGAGGLVFGLVADNRSTALANDRLALVRAQPGRCFDAKSAACGPARVAAEDATSKHSLSIGAFVAGGLMLGASAVFTVLYLGSSKPVASNIERQGLRLRVAPTVSGLVAFGEF